MPAPICDSPRGNRRGRRVICPDCGATFPLQFMGRALQLPRHFAGEKV